MTYQQFYQDNSYMWGAEHIFCACGSCTQFGHSPSLEKAKEELEKYIDGEVWHCYVALKGETIFEHKASMDTSG